MAAQQGYEAWVKVGEMGKGKTKVIQLPCGQNLT